MYKVLFNIYSNYQGDELHYRWLNDQYTDKYSPESKHMNDNHLALRHKTHQRLYKEQSIHLDFFFGNYKKDRLIKHLNVFF
jgi:hypothetical protein